MISDFSIVECDIPDPQMTLAEYRRSLTPPQHRTLFDRLRALLPQLTVACSRTRNRPRGHATATRRPNRVGAAHTFTTRARLQRLLLSATGPPRLIAPRGLGVRALDRRRLLAPAGYEKDHEASERDR